MPKLHVKPASGEPFDLVIGNTATIGRTSDNTICLSHSPLVSRQHAIIRCHNGYQFQLIDLGSRNGTYVNDQRVVMPVTLEDGAQIRIVGNTIAFEQAADDLLPAALEVTMAGASEGGASSAVQPVALLVCDIRGFSSMAEKVPSSDLAQQLGKWFRDAGNLVSSKAGTIDKFIGDAILAYWTQCSGADVDCKTTLDIAKQMIELAAKMTWPNGEPFRVGIALHYGTVICGNVGVDAQRDATIIGDPVNTVFRLEGLMKELNQLLIFSSEFRDKLSGAAEQYVDLGERTLKGKRKPVRIFALPT
ncbi:MAG: adenylate cyclase [Verrucomicrobiota bacterium]|jgi:adenylate cyclase